MTAATPGRPLSATLLPERLQVSPGRSASFELRVDGDVAPEQLRFEVLGKAAAWSWVVPPAAGDTHTRLVVQPPRAPEPSAGDHPVAVRVWAGAGESVAEGVVGVEGFADVSGSLRPPVAESRSATSHELAIEIVANTPVTLSVTPVPDEAMDVQVSHQPAAATRVLARPRRRLLRGEPRSHRFAVRIVPDTGEAVTVSGEMRQLPVLAGRAPALAGLLVVALVAGFVVRGAMSGGGGGSPVAAGSDAAQPGGGCVARGHQDTHVSGLTPDRIPTLPSGWSFSFVKDDGCSPVRFNPCQPVHFVLNPARAPSSGAADVREAFRRLGRATGIEFVDDGTTDETTRRGPYVGDRYPGRWAPILVVWTSQSGGRADIEVVGSGFPARAGDALVSGTLTLNADAVSNRARNTPLPGGFGSGDATGVGAIGAGGVTWGRVILHELAHIMGLGHTRDRDELMYPDTAEQTAQTTDYRSGDREGLTLLGRDAGCLPDPPLPDPPLPDPPAPG